MKISVSSKAADLSMQADLLKEVLGKSRKAIDSPEGKNAHSPWVNAGRWPQRGGSTRGLHCALACRTFGVSETCYHYP
jgi:hypothetical protein